MGESVAHRTGGESRDPAFLADRLIEAAQGLSGPDRARLVARLSVGGLGLPREQLEEFKKAAGLAADAAVDPARLIEAATLLAEFTLRLEPWACSYWKDLAPEARNAIYQTLGKELLSFVRGEDAPTKETLGRALHKLRSLISLLMRGAIESGRQFARDHINRYSLDAVREAAPTGAFTSEEARCWKHYERLMDGIDAGVIEKRLKGVMAKDVDAGLSQVIR